MFDTTEKQRQVARTHLQNLGGTIHTVIIHDLGTSMRIVTGDGDGQILDVDHDFCITDQGDKISRLTSELGERIMDRFRFPIDLGESHSLAAFVTTVESLPQWPVEHPTDEQVQHDMDMAEDDLTP